MAALRARAATGVAAALSCCAAATSALRRCFTGSCGGTRPRGVACLWGCDRKPAVGLLGLGCADQGLKQGFCLHDTQLVKLLLLLLRQLVPLQDAHGVQAVQASQGGRQTPCQTAVLLLLAGFLLARTGQAEI